MTLVVTAGPAWEPIDGMRRLTNASTGRLGTVLAQAWADAGHRVMLFRGEGTTFAAPERGVKVFSFGTNDDLARGLAACSASERVDAVFHAAALCDFRVVTVRGRDGTEVRAAKIPSRAGRITLELEPATKVLPRLRDWFPRARLVGWKLELNGSRDDALAAAWRQLAEARTDASVLNGPAWGDGYALCRAPQQVTACSDVPALIHALMD